MPQLHGRIFATVNPSGPQSRLVVSFRFVLSERWRLTNQTANGLKMRGKMATEMTV